MAPTKRQREPGRQILFVLGMHRSGTSALSGVLAHLGGRVPRSLMAPTNDNPKGYWESVELMKLHDRILSSAGSRWNDWSHFNPDWIETPVAASFQESLLPLLEREYGDAQLLLVKDPRISRFFPLWRKALEGTAFTPKVLLPLRHPQEVADSLAVRNHFGRYRSQLLWLRHMLEAEAATRDLKRSFVLYDALLDDWQAEARRIARDLDLQWPAWSSDSEAKIDEFLSSELRHHVARTTATGSKEFAGWADAAHRCLVELAHGQPESPRLAELDRIRAEFDRTSGIYAAVVREHETRVEGLYAKLKAQLAQSSEQVDALTSTLKEAQDDLERTARTLAERESTLVAQQAHAAELAARIEVQRAQNLDVATALEEAQLGRQHAEALVAERFQETGKLTEMVFKLEEALAKKDRAVAAATETLRERDAEHAASLRKRDAERAASLSVAALDEFRIAELRGRIANLERQLRASRDALDAVRRSNAGRLLGGLLRIPEAPAEPAADSEFAHAAPLLRQSELFDADWYRTTYLDPEGGDVDPVVHYLREGAQAGFHPGPAFDTVAYLARYPDVRRAAVNPLVHYLKHGKDEGRSAIAPVQGDA